MLHELEDYRLLCKREFTLADLTMIIALRQHDDNPWVVERLAWNSKHYDALPRVLVVDFGSAGAHSAQVAEVCRRSQFDYLYVEDSGVFSLAAARNAGAAAARTELLFFCDIDCFGTSDFFLRLLEYLNSSDIASCFESLVNLPIYHLDEERTREVMSDSGGIDSSRLLRQFNRQVYQGFSPHCYVDGASNFFVIRRPYFDLVGGYNESFRGHGSEDFEFLLRYAQYSKTLPLPAEPGKDLFGPNKDTFFQPKPYKGFRRYAELLAMGVECAGLRLAHLYHPRPLVDPWFEERDILRRRFDAEAQPFIEEPARILTYDWMPRIRRALVLLKHRRHLDFFYPLRLAGYRLDPMILGDADSERDARQRLEGNCYDAVAVFNPYMSSHKDLGPTLDLAKQCGVPLIVTDRGMLPDSWFYAEDMPYADSDYLTLELDKLEFTRTELQVASGYLEKLKGGEATLEENGDYEATRARRRANGYAVTCFIPLQLEEDVALNCFNQGYQSYADFLEQLSSSLAAFPQIRFLVKTHPLSNRSFQAPLLHRNVQICDRHDNIHALIELADVVLCYNSGAGFLGLMHGKPLATVGNAFYNLSGLGHRFEDALSALQSFRNGVPAGPNEGLVLKFLTWHIFRKYAFFNATSEITHQKSRRVHNYTQLSPYQLPFSEHLSFLTSTIEAEFASRSYAGGQFALGALAKAEAKKDGGVIVSPRRIGGSKSSRPAVSKVGKADRTSARVRRRGSLSSTERKLLKLMRDPKAFFVDAGRNAMAKVRPGKKK